MTALGAETMLVRALSFPLSNVGPEEKYFLVRFVQCFGITDPVSLDMKELAKRFGLSDRQVSASLAVLLAGGVLALSSTPDGRGRPKRSYRLQDAFVNALKKPPQKPSKSYDPPPFNEIHKEAIGRLLRHENSKAGQQSTKLEPGDGAADLSAQMRARRQRGRLSIVNRLLLGVLLCYADHLGVVSNLGSSALRKATGLNQERLKNRIDLLIEQGLIRVYVPGASSLFLYTKTKSIYFINLHHPEISDGSDVTSALAYVQFEPLGEVKNVSSIYRDARDINVNPALFEGSQYRTVLGFFKGQSRDFFYLLQFMLMRYVAHLLSKYWSGLVLYPTGQRVEVQELRDLIRKEFRLPERLLVGHDDWHAILQDELYELVYESAALIKGVLYQTLEISLESMDIIFLPLPVDLDHYRFTLLALPRLSDGWRGCEVIIEDATGRRLAKSFPREADVPLEDRYRYGLLTRPVPLSSRTPAPR